MSGSVVSVKFFASLREMVGNAESEVAQMNEQTVMDVWKRATQNMTMPENTLMAVNMEYVEGTHFVKA